MSAGGFNYPLLIDHIRREAIYFVNHLERLQLGEMINPVTNLLLEEVFWLRIMADHSKFIKHLLDPSERQLVETADDLSEELDELRFQAEDFESFLRINPIFVPSLGRFTNDAIGAIMNIRDFKAEARDLIARCEMVSLIPELLADHVLRGSGAFSSGLAGISKAVGQTYVSALKTIYKNTNKADIQARPYHKLFNGLKQ